MIPRYRRKKLQELHRIKNIHQDHHPRARTGQNKPKYHLKLQEHQDYKPTFPQNEQAEGGIPLFLMSPTKSIARIQDEAPQKSHLLIKAEKEV